MRNSDMNKLYISEHKLQIFDLKTKKYHPSWTQFANRILSRTIDESNLLMGVHEALRLLYGPGTHLGCNGHDGTTVYFASRDALLRFLLEN